MPSTRGRPVTAIFGTMSTLIPMQFLSAFQPCPGASCPDSRQPITALFLCLLEGATPVLLQGFSLHNYFGYVTMPACMRIIAGILCAFLIAVPAAAAIAEKGLTVRGVRYFTYPGFTRIVFETEEAAPYVLTRSGDRKTLYFSSYGGPFVLRSPQLPLINDGVVKGMELRQERDHRSRNATTGRSSSRLARRPATPRISFFAGPTGSSSMCFGARRPLMCRRPLRRRPPLS
jgi:hypothetical protein